ncbi:hypothetical protein F3Y22_tig00111993pilonHSYRG00040 [Hibiscus syriacus]|uniref:Uncharacterized protein n=1 Tax=Hibiscus syriacus TaxID=106335 RepID=A0A6A2YCX4_HIBSY|nr:hypothetical protein F3Y22_tig00111993pilonHSYRG00040 [Hibiscus syriacus]
MMEYIKRLRLCIKWFQELEGEYAFEQEKLTSALKLTERRCSELVVALNNKDEELNLIIWNFEKAWLPSKISSENEINATTYKSTTLPYNSRFMSSTITGGEKFRAGAERLMAQQNVLAAWRCFQKDKISTGNPKEREDTHFRKGDRSSWPVNRFLMNKNEDIHEQAKPFSDSIQQKTSLETRCCDSPKIAKPRTPLKGKSKNELSVKKGSNSRQHLFLGSQETVTQNEDIHEQAKPFSDSIQLKTRLEARCCESPKIAKPRTRLKGKSKNAVKQGSNSQQNLFLVSQETVTRNKDIHEQAKPFSDSVQLKTRLEARCCESSKIAKPSTPLKRQSKMSIENKIGEEEGDDHHQHLGLESQFQDNVENEISEEEGNGLHQHLGLESQSHDTVENEIDEEEGDDHHQHLGLYSQMRLVKKRAMRQHLELDSQSQDTLEKSSTYYINDSNENEVAEEEEDQYQQYFEESNEYDCFSNISQPKSYWESLRKAWYNEVLNTVPKMKIYVSQCKERMKRLITSRAQSQADGAESQREVEGKEETIEPMCCLQTNLHREGDQGEEQEDDDDNDDEQEEEDEDEEERILSSHECQQEVEGKEETIQPMCCLHTNLHPEGDQGEEEQEDDEEEEKEKERSLSSHECQQEFEGKEETLQPMCCQQTNLHPEGDQGEEEQEDDRDEYGDEEERSLSTHECHEANNYCDQSSSSLQMPSPNVTALGHGVIKMITKLGMIMSRVHLNFYLHPNSLKLHVSGC